MTISEDNRQKSPDHMPHGANKGERPSPNILDVDATVWKDKNTYGMALVERYLEPLRSAKSKSGQIPRTLQNSVLCELQSYFATDLRERSPTVIVTEPMAVEFHALVKEIMSYIELDMIAAIDENLASQEVKHALLSYKAPSCYSPIVLDAYDHDQKLVRLSYFIHGIPPSETFLIDGEQVQPTYQKYRACRFFKRMLLRQRIVWLAASGNKTIQVLLNGEVSELTVESSAFLSTSVHKQVTTSQSLQAVSSTYPPGKGKPHRLFWNLTGFKVRAVRWLARISPFRRKFSKAWIFIDRETEADDNAEHLYRWVKEKHPEINAWFLLDRTSTDWDRLNDEGFRLVPQGWWRKLLILNAEHIISSHAEYVYGGLDRHYYGDLMTWRYSFLQHGVIQNDLSHWLSSLPFDLFITTSPVEHKSITGNDTPYTYTEKEMRRTGLARHDRLITIAKKTPLKKADLLLILPTWRGSLNSLASKSELADSSYVRHWGSLLRSATLQGILRKSGLRLAFMPHTNAVPYLDLFDIPDEVEVFTKSDTRIQDLFVRSVAMITDYSSVAFEMAVLRRCVFYYQFDRSHFYSGDHNWREGYFDYDRDGFGPVAIQENELIAQIQKMFANDLAQNPEYFERMRSATPDQDGLSCERVFQAIMGLKRPFF